ncbi:MAG: nucleotidyl transferase AbiEii/AbiGii toxin family protein [Candidatus Eisenbacteria sp.]|nr:nucleotidyl transferase AbiEii/AbiGii toxin family protein [Candidatus Eisenbacteria bacterium]
MRDLPDPARRLNVLREYLQACILRSLHESEASVNLSFVGGTALRFLFNLPRFSEDLDFSLERRDGYDPSRWMDKLGRDLSLAGFDLTLKRNDRKTVHLFWIRVAGILAESGLADRPEQKLSIKLEIDTQPPAGAVSLTEIVTRHIMFSVRHHDLPSLMAGKIHALCTRSYSKGRDWYDLLWYRTQRPPVEPNLIMLQNALDQTEGVSAVDGSCWTRHLLQRIGTLDTSRLASEVRPFLERPADADLLAARNFRSVLDE